MTSVPETQGDRTSTLKNQAWTFRQRRSDPERKRGETYLGDTLTPRPGWQESRRPLLSRGRTLQTFEEVRQRLSLVWKQSVDVCRSLLDHSYRAFSRMTFGSLLLDAPWLGRDIRTDATFLRGTDLCQAPEKRWDIRWSRMISGSDACPLRHGEGLVPWKFHRSRMVERPTPANPLEGLAR